MDNKWNRLLWIINTLIMIAIGLNNLALSIAYSIMYLSLVC